MARHVQTAVVRAAVEAIVADLVPNPAEVHVPEARAVAVGLSHEFLAGRRRHVASAPGRALGGALGGRARREEDLVLRVPQRVHLLTAEVLVVERHLRQVASVVPEGVVVGSPAQVDQALGVNGVAAGRLVPGPAACDG